MEAKNPENERDEARATMPARYALELLLSALRPLMEFPPYVEAAIVKVLEHHGRANAWRGLVLVWRELEPGTPDVEEAESVADILQGLVHNALAETLTEFVTEQVRKQLDIGPVLEDAAEADAGPVGRPGGFTPRTKLSVPPKVRFDEPGPADAGARPAGEVELDDDTRQRLASHGAPTARELAEVGAPLGDEDDAAAATRRAEETWKIQVEEGDVIVIEPESLELVSQSGSQVAYLELADWRAIRNHLTQLLQRYDADEETVICEACGDDVPCSRAQGSVEAGLFFCPSCIDAFEDARHLGGSEATDLVDVPGSGPGGER